MLDPEKLLGAQLEPKTTTWTYRDVILYALGLGVGADGIGPTELRRLYEKDLEVLPTFGALGAMLDVGAIPALPGAGFDPSAVLHGEQEFVLHRPVPADGEAVCEATVVGVHEKGKNALVVVDAVTRLNGEPLVTGRGGIFCRGEGGFGGSYGEALAAAAPRPDREPDAVVNRTVALDQGALYRLSGDWNTLHIDPDVATAVGFPSPILHGMCSFGIAVTAVVDELLDGDVSVVRSYRTRFAGVAYPGDVLRISAWRVDDGALFEVVATNRDDAPVLTGGAVTIKKES